MTTVLEFIKEMFISLLALLFMFSPLSDPSMETYGAKDPENVQLSLSVISDVHIETNNSESYSNFDRVLRDIKRGEDNDALVFLGDNVMNGQLTEDFLFYTALKGLKPSENIFVATGNHDLGNGEGDFDKFMRRYLMLNNTVLGADIEKPYFYRVINGHYLIFLSTEHQIIDYSHISEEQFEWLEGVLELAGESGKPIFVFHHYPITLIDGEDKYRLVNMLKEYDNVLYMHGHYHQYRIYNEGGINCINLPRVTETVEYEPGTGAVVEVYEDEVLVRIRDFYNGEWTDTELHYPR